MDHRDKLIQLVKMRGPLIPSQINKEIGTDTLFASAMLSELVDKKIIKLSHVKVGGSPVYYAPGQESKLQTYYDRLKAPEKNAFDRLKLQKVLRDIDQEPVIRVALRQIKDFAVPLDVNLNGTIDLFWRWYLISDNESGAIIKEQLGINDEKKEEPVAEPITEPVPKKEASTQAEPRTAQQPIIPRESERTPVPQPHNMQPPAHQISASDVAAELKSELREQLKKEIQGELQSELKQHLKAVEQQVEKRELKAEKQQNLDTKPDPQVLPDKETPAKTIKKPQKKRETTIKESFKVKEEPIAKIEEKKEPEGDEFYDEVKYFFKRNHVDIIEFKVIRKNSEAEFIVEVPSNVGSLRYFCKAKSKSKINDADLAAIYVQGQMKKLPVLLLTPGELTKKAKQMLDSEFRSITVKKIS